jgi:cytochrome c biogenesis protein CcmG/thiol:disulfide interchange protein DsbE
MKLFISLIIMFLIQTVLFAQSNVSAASGRLAPNFKLEDLDNEIIELKNFIGKGPILLCFWSSCCKSAVSQIEAFSDLYIDYEARGFTLLAIATDDEKTVAKVKPYIKSKKYKFLVLYDTDGNVSRMYYAFNIPFCVLINKSGEITYSHLGYMKGDEIELVNKVKVLLNET